MLQDCFVAGGQESAKFMPRLCKFLQSQPTGQRMAISAEKHDRRPSAFSSRLDDTGFRQTKMAAAEAQRLKPPKVSSSLPVLASQTLMLVAPAARRFPSQIESGPRGSLILPALRHLLVGHPWVRMISRSALSPGHRLAQRHPEVDFCVRLKWGSAGGAQLGIRRRARR
jgi:hypothetical protein